MDNNFTCEEILKLIRATKTFNLNRIKVGNLEISRGHDVQSRDPKQVTTPIADESQIPVLQNELAEYDQENLLITDPMEYEKRVGNG